jgi:hypothetical protein
VHKDRLNLVDKLLDSETPIMDRRIRPARRHHAGRNTGLNQSVWLATVFELNELHAMRGEFEKVLNDRQIIFNWEQEFPQHLKPKNKNSKVNPGGALTSGKKTLGMYRTEYRKGIIFSGQLKPILCSFRYTKEGYPRKDGRSFEIITFEECRQLCLSLKVADPRFFDATELGKIKQHAKETGNIHQWAIPSINQWKELNDSIAGGVFKSLRMYDVPYDPTSWSPPEDD